MSTPPIFLLWTLYILDEIRASYRACAYFDKLPTLLERSPQDQRFLCLRRRSDPDHVLVLILCHTRTCASKLPDNIFRDSVEGRYDPPGLNGQGTDNYGPNVYTYVTQNPWTFFDPLGLAQGAPRNKPATDQMFYPKLAYSIFVQPFVEAQQVGQMHLEQAAAEAGDGNVGMAASHTAAAVFEAVTTAVVEIGPAKFIKKAGKLNDVGKGVDATADLNRGVNGADNAIDAADALNDADRATDMTESAADIPPNQTGSYTNYHESGKTYDGKGTRARSQASGRRVERETGDSHTATEWDSADNTRDAFKDESLKLDSHGGAESADNYNKIESPGKKMREQDGET